MIPEASWKALKKKLGETKAPGKYTVSCCRVEVVFLFSFLGNIEISI